MVYQVSKKKSFKSGNIFLVLFYGFFYQVLQ